MSKLKPSRDIQPVTEFRANAAQFIEQVQETGEPVILTQHGRSAAVLLDVGSYERMVDELALLRDVRVAEKQIAAGKGRSHTAVVKTLRARLKR
ncbi:MAG TPA: type II toxin-antitoxin system Phd/YefM family antitoxin [Gemmatimonadaceae bacterium]